MASYNWPAEGGVGVGTVTSVGLADDSTEPIYSIGGSPVTTDGTLTLTLITQSANLVFAGPTTGGALEPIFRSLVSADIPTLAYISTTLGATALSGGLTVSGNTLSAAQVAAGQNGWLSSTDWNTFNAKQPAGSYITALTGDATASGPGSAVLTLATVNSNVGTFASVTVNAKGLVTAAANLSGDATTSSSVLTLATVNSNVGSFTNASVTVNAKGLVTAVSSGTAPVTSLTVATANGFSGSSSGGQTPALTLATTITSPVLAGNGTAILAGTTTGTGSTVVLATSPSLTTPALGTPSAGVLTSCTGLPLTTGVTGVLPIANGGTDNGSLGVTAGGVIYTDGTKFQNVGSGSSAQFLMSNGSSAPSWANPTISLKSPAVQTFLVSTGYYTFTVTALTTAIVAGATYTNNGQTFTALYNYAIGSTSLSFSIASGAPTSSGTLTLASGTGQSSIAFSANVATGTYQLPLGALYIKIQMVGGGGGGASSGAAPNSGGNGGTTTFGSILTAGGGLGGGSGSGGTNTISGGSILVNVVGGGGGGGNFSTSTSQSGIGGQGGASYFGGAGYGGPAANSGAAGGNGASNSGGGGGGGGQGTGASSVSGGGGGSGGYVESFIFTPSSTYTFSVGAGGAGGAAGNQAGGNGGSGALIITQYYQ